MPQACQSRKKRKEGQLDKCTGQYALPTFQSIETRREEISVGESSRHITCSLSVTQTQSHKKSHAVAFKVTSNEFANYNIERSQTKVSFISTPFCADTGSVAQPERREELAPHDAHTLNDNNKFSRSLVISGFAYPSKLFCCTNRT